MISAAHRVKAVAAVLMLVLLAAAGMAMAVSADVLRAAMLLGIGHAAWGFAENYGARLQAEERMHVWLRANLVFGVCSGVLAGAAVLLARSVTAFSAGFAAGQCSALLYLVLRERGAVVGGAPVAAEVRRLARATMPFAVAFLLLTIFYKVDVLLLARLRDAYAAGLYAAGYKLIDVLHALAVVAAAAVYPRLARSGAGAARTLELFVLGAVPAAGLLWLVRTPLVHTLLGPSYAETAVVLGVLAPAAALLTVNIAAGYLLALADRLRLLAAAYGAAVLVKVVLGALWMPLEGAVGAARAMLSAEVAAAVALLLALRAARVALPAWRPVLAAAGVAAWAYPSARLDPAPAVAAFVAGTVVLYAAAGVLTRAERGAVAALVGRGPVRAPEPT